MTGHIVQINISRGGLPKRAVPEGMITPLGIEGDCCAHPAIHGGPERAVLLLGAEVVEELIARGYPLYFGAMGESLTTRGLDRRQLRIGQRLRAGGAVLEIASIRGPCSALDVYGSSLQREIYDERVKAGDTDSPRWGMSGFYLRVLEPGPVATNGIIVVESTSA
jgi:MOSC domain-containing protein YiiM